MLSRMKQDRLVKHQGIIMHLSAQLVLDSQLCNGLPAVVEGEG